MASDCIRTSVVIPVYNGGGYLARTLDSVLNQSVADFEVICVDDGSSDDGLTNAVLEEYAQKDSRVRVLRQKNQGPSAARNFGVQESRGKYVYDILTTKYGISKERLIVKSEVVKKAAKPELSRAVVISF